MQQHSTDSYFVKLVHVLQSCTGQASAVDLSNGSDFNDTHFLEATSAVGSSTQQVAYKDAVY